MEEIGKSAAPGFDANAFFAWNPVFTTDSLARAVGGRRASARAAEISKYYRGTGRLKLITPGVQAVVPAGLDAESFSPDPYLVPPALRADAILSHHAALDLNGAGHSLFFRYTYFTAQPRRRLGVGGCEWVALAHPVPLVRAGKVDFGVRDMDRQGVRLRVTSPERTLVDGMAAPGWAGGLEELVESAAGFRYLDLDLVYAYLELLDRRILFAAVGWFLERHPEVADDSARFLGTLAARVPRNPVYLDRRRGPGRVQSRWNLIVPAHLSLDQGFEGAPRDAEP